jgi:hypothetical protein
MCTSRSTRENERHQLAPSSNACLASLLCSASHVMFNKHCVKQFVLQHRAMGDSIRTYSCKFSCTTSHAEIHVDHRLRLRNQAHYSCIPKRPINFLLRYARKYLQFSMCSSIPFHSRAERFSAQKSMRHRSFIELSGDSGAIPGQLGGRQCEMVTTPAHG